MAEPLDIFNCCPGTADIRTVQIDLPRLRQVLKRILIVLCNVIVDARRLVLDMLYGCPASYLQYNLKHDDRQFR